MKDCATGLFASVAPMRTVLRAVFGVGVDSISGARAGECECGQSRQPFFRFATHREIAEESDLGRQGRSRGRGVGSLLSRICLKL